MPNLMVPSKTWAWVLATGPKSGVVTARVSTTKPMRVAFTNEQGFKDLSARKLDFYKYAQWGEVADTTNSVGVNPGEPFYLLVWNGNPDREAIFWEFTYK